MYLWLLLVLLLVTAFCVVVACVGVGVAGDVGVGVVMVPVGCGFWLFSVAMVLNDPVVRVVPSAVALCDRQFVDGAKNGAK